MEANSLVTVTEGPSPLAVMGELPTLENDNIDVEMNHLEPQSTTATTPVRSTWTRHALDPLTIRLKAKHAAYQSKAKEMPTMLQQAFTKSTNMAHAYLLAEIDDHALPSLGDHLLRRLELGTTVAANGAEDVTGQALGVHADEHVVGGSDLTHDEGDRVLVVDLRLVDEDVVGLSR